MGKRKRKSGPTKAKKKQANAAKHWFLTINNPTEEDVRAFYNEDFVLADHITYVMLGEHIGEKRKVPHIHVVIACKNRMRMTALKKYHPRADIQNRRGTIAECEVYLSKDKKMFEIGERPLPTLECRWEESIKCAKEGRLSDIPPDMLVRYYHAFKRMEQDNPVKPPDLKERDNYWIVAPSGFGKSTWAREKWPDHFDKAPNKWWIGYKGEPTILFDDLGPKQCEHLDWYMKRWSDKFSFPMESKGGGRQIRPQHIVVTSQYTIDECWDDCHVCDAIKNRFKVIEFEDYREQHIVITKKQ